MLISIDLNANELDIDLVTKIKSLFAGERIRLTVTQQHDETEYLLQDAMLLSRVESPATQYISFDADGFAALAASIEAGESLDEKALLRYSTTIGALL